MLQGKATRRFASLRSFDRDKLTLSDTPRFIINDPVTGEAICICDAASPQDPSEAVACALAPGVPSSVCPSDHSADPALPPDSIGKSAFDSGVWSRVAPSDRASIMSAIAKGLAESSPYSSPNRQGGRLRNEYAAIYISRVI